MDRPNDRIPGDASFDGEDHARREIDRARRMAAAGDRDAAVRSLRDLALDFPHLTSLAEELDRLRAGDEEVEDKPVEAPAPRAVEQPVTDSPATDHAPVPRPAATADSRHAQPPARGRSFVLGGILGLVALLAVVAIAGVLPSIVATNTPVSLPGVQPAAPAPVPAPLPQIVSTPDPAAAAPPEPPRRVARPRRAPEDFVATYPMATERPGESIVAWRVRSRELAATYATAQEALAREDFTTAIAALTRVVREDPLYPNAAAELDAARRARSDRAVSAAQEASRLEESGQWRAALEAYNRALALDPTLAGPATRIAALRRSVGVRTSTALREAAVADALGLSAYAAAAYARAVELLPADDPDRARAEQRLAALSVRDATAAGGGGLPPPSEALDLVSSSQDLQSVVDAAGRFAVRIPERGWTIWPGPGSPLATIVDDRQPIRIVIEAVPLTAPLTFAEHGEALELVEWRLIADRVTGARDIRVRRPRPPLSLAVLDYERRPPQGSPQLVRQFSLLRGASLYRIVATAPMPVVAEVEGIINDVARSFEPAPAR